MLATYNAVSIKLSTPVIPNDLSRLPFSQTSAWFTLTFISRIFDEYHSIVELQFIANEINKVPAICTYFQSAAGAADFQTFFNTINDQPNLVFVQSAVNNAKGIVFGDKNFKDTTEKAAVRLKHSRCHPILNRICLRCLRLVLSATWDCSSPMETPHALLMLSMPR